MNADGGRVANHSCWSAPAALGFFLLAACSSSTTAPTTQAPCVAPNYVNCPTFSPVTMLLVNHAAAVVELEAA
jgi:hypothetical protein